MVQVLNLEFKTPNKDKVAEPFEAVAAGSAKAASSASRMEQALVSSANKSSKALNSSASSFQKVNKRATEMARDSQKAAQAQSKLQQSVQKAGMSSGSASQKLQGLATAAQNSGQGSAAATAANRQLVAVLDEVKANTSATTDAIKSMHFSLTLGQKAMMAMVGGLGLLAVGTVVALKKFSLWGRITAAVSKQKKKLKDSILGAGGATATLGKGILSLRSKFGLLLAAIAPFSPAIVGFILQSVEGVKKVSKLLNDTIGGTAREWEIQLHQMAYATRTNVDMMGQAVQNMSWYFGVTGASAQEAREVVAKLTEALKTYGASNEEVAGTLDMLNSSISQGKIDAQLIQELWSKQPVLFRELADAVAFTGHKLRDFTEYNHATALSMVELANDGKLGVDVLKEFNQQLIENNKITDEFQKIDPTFSELWDSLKTAVSEFFTEFARWPVILNPKLFLLTQGAKAFIGVLKGGMQFLTGVLRLLTEVLRKINEAFDWAARGLTEFLGLGDGLLELLGLVEKKTNQLTEAEKVQAEERAKNAQAQLALKRSQIARDEELAKIADQRASKALKDNSGITRSMEEVNKLQDLLIQKLRDKGATEEQILKESTKFYLEHMNLRHKSMSIDEEEQSNLLKKLDLTGAMIAKNKKYEKAVEITANVLAEAKDKEDKAWIDLNNSIRDFEDVTKRADKTRIAYNESLAETERLRDVAKAGIGNVLTLLAKEEDQLWALSVGNRELFDSMVKTADLKEQSNKLDAKYLELEKEVLEVNQRATVTTKTREAALRQHTQALNLHTGATQASTKEEKKRLAVLKEAKKTLEKAYDEFFQKHQKAFNQTFYLQETAMGYIISYGDLTARVYSKSADEIDRVKDSLVERAKAQIFGNEKVREGAEAEETFEEYLKRTNEALDPQTGKLKEKGKEMERFAKSTTKAIIAEEDFTVAVRGADKVLTASTKTVYKYKESVSEAATATSGLSDAERRLKEAVEAHDFEKMYQAQVEIAEAKERANVATRAGIDAQRDSNRMLSDTIDINERVSDSYRDIGDEIEKAGKLRHKWFDPETGIGWSDLPPEKKKERESATPTGSSGRWGVKAGKLDPFSGTLSPYSGYGTPPRSFGFGNDENRGSYFFGFSPHQENAGMTLIERIAKDVAGGATIAALKETYGKVAGFGDRGFSYGSGRNTRVAEWHQLIPFFDQNEVLETLKPDFADRGLYDSKSVLAKMFTKFLGWQVEHLPTDLFKELSALGAEYMSDGVLSREEETDLRNRIADHYRGLKSKDPDAPFWAPILQDYINATGGLLDQHLDVVTGIQFAREDLHKQKLIAEGHRGIIIRSAHDTARDISRQETLDVLAEAGVGYSRTADTEAGLKYKQAVHDYGTRLQEAKEAAQAAGGGGGGGTGSGGGPSEQSLNEAQSRRISLLENELNLRDSFSRSIARQVMPIGRLPTHGGESLFSEPTGGTAIPIEQPIPAIASGQGQPQYQAPPPSVTQSPPIEVTVVIDPDKILQAGLESTDTDTDNAIRNQNRNVNRNRGEPNFGSVSASPSNSGGGGNQPFIYTATNG